ncbi:diaminopimelate epimerase, partial [Thermodesulfobacteriota bacterium]
MNPIPFSKMSGTGNDFIIIDNRQRLVEDDGLTEFIRNVCRRKMSVGADGLILIESSDKADFRWRFFNSDGSLAEMCGNGARCAARFAYLNGIAGENLFFETEAGIINGEVKDGGAKVKIPDPVDFRLDYRVDLENGPLIVSSVNTGVPHVVVMMDSVAEVDVFGLGREIRYHEAFAPAGANVNFICQQKPGQ